MRRPQPDNRSLQRKAMDEAIAAEPREPILTLAMEREPKPFEDNVRSIMQKEERSPKGERSMPIHDWTRVDAGIFHAFHHGWIEELSRRLNRGLLPEDYYALP